MSADDALPLPTFLIIGAQKSATRWLRRHLGEHPEVFTADSEPGFFIGGRFKRGLDWYRTSFEGWNGEPIVGEATPAYMMWHMDPARMAARIDDSLPGARLVALLRNPVDRTYSAFIHHMRRGRIPPNADLLDRIRGVAPEDDELRLISGGWYAASLGPYLARFGERLQISLHDEVLEDPRGVYERTLEHIGASPGFLPPQLQRIRHSGKPPETSPYYAENGAGDRRELTPEERVALYEYFREDMDRLEELLGRDLGVWRPS